MEHSETAVESSDRPFEALLARGRRSGTPAPSFQAQRRRGVEQLPSSEHALRQWPRSHIYEPTVRPGELEEIADGTRPITSYGGSVRPATFPVFGASLVYGPPNCQNSGERHDVRQLRP